MSTRMSTTHFHSSEPPATFRSLWLERFQLDDWVVLKCCKRLPMAPEPLLPVALDYLFLELPARIKTKGRRDEGFCDLADAFGWICLALWQGTSPFPHPLTACAARLLACLKGELSPVPPDVLAVAGLIHSYYADGECGLNRLILDDAVTIAAHEAAVQAGDFEQYLTAEGVEKFREYQHHLTHSAAFAADWALIKRLFGNPEARWPDLVIEGKLRRTLLPERNWEQQPWWSFADEREQFRVVFAVFCWKWFLWAMEGDRPLLMKPSVNVTPYGTQIFVPGYMSLDFKRDLKHGAISELHKARGVQRHSVLRNRVREVATAARQEDRSVLKAVRDAFPELEERQIRRWLG